jgi:PAS domain S-box-containing protein
MIQFPGFEDIFLTIREPLLVLDEELKVLLANHSFYEAFKVTPDETMGNSIFAVGNRQWDIPSLRKLFEELLPVNSNFDNYQVEHVFPTIGHRIMLLNARRIYHEGIGMQMILVAIEDVTELKQMEDELRESEERYRLVFETSKDGLLILDKETGNITHANPAVAELLGYSREEFFGKKPHEIGVLKDVEDFQETEQELDKAGFIHYDDASVETKEGQRVAADIYLINRAGWIQCSIRDITNNKKLEGQLRQAQKMEAVGLLAGGIAHDFNNILSAISGYGFLLHTKMSSNDPLRVNVEQILESAERAAEVTHSLLAFSKKQVLNPRRLNINDIIRRFEKLLTGLIGEDIGLKTVFTDKAGTVMADAGQIEQVLMNLATNARDAMPSGGYLTMSTGTVILDDTFIRTYGYGEPGTYALISVSDTGIGMEQETVDKIFEPFFTTKVHEKGTGLGLAMVYGIIKQHNGYINVYSEPGQGTTFRIYLPAIETREEAVVTAACVAPLKGGTETVLVAEDDEKLRKLSEIVLKQYGYDVILSKDGEDAIKKFADNKDKIQLVILDMIMPKKNGIEVYEEIKKMRPDIKTIFSSGYTADRKDKDKMFEGGLDFIMKPVSPKDLLGKIREVLDK